jgi:hypothetical protein
LDFSLLRVKEALWCLFNFGARFITVLEFIRIEDQPDGRERYAEEEEDLNFAKIVSIQSTPF